MIFKKRPGPKKLRPRPLWSLFLLLFAPAAYAVCPINPGNLPADCVTGCTVNSIGGEDHTTIQAAVNALPTTLTGHTCIVIMNGAVYSERVTIEGFTNNGSSLTIMKTPLGPRPIVQSPSQAAFVVKNTSVNIVGIDVQPAIPLPYGILVSSSYVTISSVNVDGGANITNSGIALSSWAVVSNTSVTVQSAYGIYVEGAQNRVVSSTATSNLIGKYALYFNGSSSNTVAGSYFSNGAGYAAVFDGKASNNMLTQSTVSSGGNGYAAVFFDNVSSNSVARSYLSDDVGYGALINSGSRNTISQSTMASVGAAFSALYLFGTSSNTVSQSFITSVNGTGTQITSSYYNQISLSTMTAGGSGASALYFSNSSGNALTQGYFSNPGGYGVYFNSNGSSNTITASTMAANSLTFSALYAFDASSNSLIHSYASNPLGAAVYLSTNSNANMFLGGTIKNNVAGRAALYMTGASSNSVSQSFISNTAGAGASIINGSNYNGISLSTITGLSAGEPAFHVRAASFNSVGQSYLSNLSGDALTLDVNANWNSVSQSTVVSNSAAHQALLLLGASSNTVALSLISNPPGVGASLTANSKNNSIMRSTVSTAGAGLKALYITGSSSNTVSQSYLSSPNGNAAVIDLNSTLNTLLQSTMTTDGAAYFALYIQGASSSTISRSYLRNTAGTAAKFDTNANANAVVLSTAAGVGAGNSGLWLNGASSNTVSQSYLSNPSGYGAYLNQSSSNSISLSTMSNATAFYASLYLLQSASNTMSQSLFQNSAGTAAWVDTNSHNNLISSSVIAGGGAGAAALYVKGSSYTVVSQSFASNGAGNAVFLDANASFGSISLSTLTGGGSGYSGLYLKSASSNTISQSYIFNPTGTGLFMDIGASSNTVAATTMVSAGASAAALYLSGASSNTFSQSVMNSPSGIGVKLDAAADYNAISQSTLTSSAANLPALYLSSVSAFAISASYLQGSTAAVISASTATTVGSSVLVATNTAGSALALLGGSAGLSVLASTISGGAQGRGVFIGAGNSGQIFLSTNTVNPTAQYGIFIATQTSATALWIASNTIVPAISSSRDTFGIYIDGLVSGATIQNNGIYYRSAGGMGTFTSYAVYAKSASGLNIDHNRINQPALVAGGGFTGVHLVSSVYTQFKFNDMHSARGGTAAGVLLKASAGSASLQVKNNVFVGTMTLIEIAANSQSGFLSNYNDFFSLSGATNTVWGASTYTSLVGWQGASGQDAGANSVNPYWYSTLPGTEDFHVRSQFGGYNIAAAGFIFDSTTSQTIDAADPAESVGVEPAPNGSRANQGSYGGSAQASKTITRLQVLLPGEVAAPGTVPGKTGSVGALSAGTTFTVTVRATDQNWNVNSAIGDTVLLSTAAAISSNLNQAAVLVSGSYSFSNIVVNASIAAMTLVATDASNSSVISDTSTVFTVFAVTGSSPTATITIPASSIRSTLNGGFTGSASDGTAVAVVKLAIQEKAANKFYDWSSPGFTAGVPSYATATLSAANATATNWSLPFSDAGLTSGTSYYVLVVATNSSNNQGVVETTFTFNNTSLTAGSAGDGKGSAVVSPSTSVGCQLITSTVIFTAGAAISPGGFIAVHIPDGWTRPVSSGPTVPALPGFINVASTTTFTVELNPIRKSSATLGDNWIVYNPVQDVTAGQTIFFTYRGFPPGGSAALTPQYFAVQTQGAGNGNLVSISTSPSMTLGAGPAAGILFSPPDPLSLGPGQFSPSMQIRLTDQCGVSTTAASAIAIALSAGNFSVTDSTAVFDPVAVTISSPNSASPAFNFKTSTTGLTYEFLIATATLGGNVVTASRYVRLVTSSVTISSVSVDNGTLTYGAVIATMTGGGFKNPVFINFGLSQTGHRWEVIISSNSSDFTPEVAHRFGSGDTGRSLSWNGINEKTLPNQFVPPGVYHVKILVEAGVISNQTLRIHVPESGSIFGKVLFSDSSPSTAAYVSATGPGANYGSFAAASTTGYFHIFGLQAGTPYSITASSGVVSSFTGQFVKVATGATGIIAQNGGVSAGTMTFPSPSFIRVSVSIPTPAPKEFWGSLYAHNADYSKTGYGTLHYSSGSSTSDDGAQDFGITASTWSLVGVSSGTFDVDINLFQLGLSTTVKNLAVFDGASTDVAIVLLKKANIYGYAILPATTTSGSYISLQATQAGKKAPTAFGGGFVPASSVGVNPTSATYTLFGLDAGSWTVTARAQGFASVSSSVYISSSADVGSELAGGFNLSLGSGGVISGSVSVSGDTTLLADTQPGPGFDLFINAYNPATFTHSASRVRLATHAALTSSTFTLTGLENGTQYVSAHLSGFTDVQKTVIVAAGAGTVSLALTPNDARIFLTVKLPGTGLAVSDFKKVALMLSGSDIRPSVKQDMISGSTVTYYSSSATLQSPPLGPGYYRVDALYGPTGQFKSASVPLTNGTTVNLTLDLSGSTYTVGGSVVMTGNVSFSSANYVVTISSIAGLLNNASATSYCLMGQALPITTTAAHMELVPIDALNSSFLSGSLFTATSPALGCGMVSLPDLGSSPNPLLGYIAPINPDGSFLFGGVAPGIYMMRNNAEMDNDAANGDELPQIRQVVRVSATVAGLSLKLDGGLSISGNLVAPVSTKLSRPFGITLLDSLGKTLRYLVVNFNNSNSAAYVFNKIPDGAYALRVSDLGYPALYAARPAVVKVLGLNVAGQDISLTRSGLIKGSLAIQQLLADGTTGPLLLVSQSNSSLLPKNFKIEAKANPWFQGGFTSAAPDRCASGVCPVLIDANNQFVIENLLPGVYDVNFISRNDAADISAGGVNLVSAFVPGVVVSEGRVAELGTVSLVAALQLRGKVIDAATSLPLSNIPLTATPSNRQAATRDVPRAATDKDGNYVLGGLDPKVRYYDIAAAARGDAEGEGIILASYGQKISPSVDLSSVTTLNFSLSMASFSIRGQVLAPSGGPALSIPLGDGGQRKPGALVFLQKAGVIATKTPIADIMAVSDRDGNFTLTSLSTGSYKLIITSLDYGSLSRGVTISTDSVNLGTLTMPIGSALTGSLLKSDGSSPSQDEVRSLVAVTSDLSEVLLGSLSKDANTKTVTGYSVSGFRTTSDSVPVSYRLMLLDWRGTLFTPEEARSIVFKSTESRTLDIVFRQPKPTVLSKARKIGSDFQVQFETSQPLRAKTADDDKLELILTTVVAKGSLSKFELSGDRTKLTALYSGVGESSFTLRLSGYSGVTDPDSIDPVNPQFRLFSQATFYVGIDGFHESAISNYAGGNLLVEGNAGRITLPSAAFSVDASSTVTVTLQISSDTLAKVGLSALRYGSPQEANIASLRHAPSAYPEHILRAMAATPPSVSPFSGFYDILLPLGVRTALAHPVQMTIAYSSGTDPNTLNLYWYNAAANAYILQQDVTGAAPVIDTVNRTITINVNHFSTFVLFQTGVAVVSGDTFEGDFIEAYNLPNPFDLSVKTVTTIHSAGNNTHTVRGTLVSFSLPRDVSGEAFLRIFNVAGDRVRSIPLGTLAGASHYYQGWDGRNEIGKDVASGVYIGQVKVGNVSKFFKMALIK